MEDVAGWEALWIVGYTTQKDLHKVYTTYQAVVKLTRTNYDFTRKVR